jgi:hypothetical protein
VLESESSESESRYPLSLAQGRNTAGVHIISVTQHGKHRTTRTPFLFFCFTVMHYCVHVQESVCMRVLSIPSVYSAPPTLNLQEVYQYSKVYMQYLYTAYILISPCIELSVSEGSSKGVCDDTQLTQSAGVILTTARRLTSFGTFAFPRVIRMCV